MIDINSIIVEALSGALKNQLTEHLKSDDFFNSDNYEQSVITLNEGETLTDGKAVVKGDLTIKEITHPISFTVTRNGNQFTATVVVDRTLYGVRYGSGKFFENLGDNMIDDSFTLKVIIYTNK